jgi:hypothetical protein
MSSMDVGLQVCILAFFCVCAWLSIEALRCEPKRVAVRSRHRS